MTDINFPRLTDLYFNYKTSQGMLRGRYEFTGLGNDWRTMRGSGKVEVSNGDVFAIPIFGPLSGILNKILPGSGYSNARAANADFKVEKGVIHTEDFEAAGALFSMLGHGDIYFLDDKLDFNLRLNMKGPGMLLTPSVQAFRICWRRKSEKTRLASSGFKQPIVRKSNETAKRPDGGTATSPVRPIAIRRLIPFSLARTCPSVAG